MSVNHTVPFLLVLFFDGVVKSRIPLFFVIPAKAGAVRLELDAERRVSKTIQCFQGFLDSRLRGSDTRKDFLRDPLLWASKEKNGFPCNKKTADRKQLAAATCDGRHPRLCSP